jgi:hypothetical protein
MSEAEHERAVRAALRVDGALRTTFARLGNAEHPDGAVLRAYRVARRAAGHALSAAPASGLRYSGVAETLGELRMTLQRVARETLLAAAAAGEASARAQLALYGTPVRPTIYDVQPALAAWLAVVDGQVAAVQAAAVTGAELELILGDGAQPGMLNPAPVTREGARWAGVVAQASWWAWIGGGLGSQRSNGEFQKQASAAIDERTTDCCLRAHGQVVDLDADFVLTGEPRYADRLQWVPFHWYCRSSVALVRRRDAGGGFTQQMLDAAWAELRAREGGRRVEIHPSHARSKR